MINEIVVDPTYQGKANQITPLLRGDADIGADVIEEVEYDPAVTVHDITSVVEEGVVTLTGIADTYAARQAAYEAAWRVSGVRGVINQIVVDPGLLGVPTDAEIAADVRERLQKDFLVPKDRITVSVRDGIVTLTGAVNWYFQREAAREEADDAKGVLDVNNEIVVDRSSASPQEIQSSIRKALVRSAQVDASKIQVAVDGSHVTLTGTARSFAEQQAAENAAWRARGVTDVSDKIVIRPPD